MKLLALDLETTGDDPDLHQIIEIGAIVFDHEDNDTSIHDLPNFHTYVCHDTYVGQAVALAMNADILRTIANWEGPLSVPKIDYAIIELERFINQHFDEDEKVPLLGFNVASFDGQFLRKAGYSRSTRGSIELGSMLSTDGLRVGSGDAFKQYLGLDSNPHRALVDAQCAVDIYRRHWL